ncbi:MAG: 1-acyl-sn-glycerol-3-phosphate acyltransferase, partial [Clostridia bacterium]|nr:1-acyl-sn-glycerol-3-phosphate acyltransferase [Clostridia bacterium]
LPLSSSLKTSALLGRAVGEILSRGDFILIYPEQAMWWNYDKPRPLRPGAYYYAASNSVPVVPTFTTLSPKRKDREMLPDNVAWTLHVGAPILPDPSLTVRENASRMMSANLEFNRSVYAAEHGACPGSE